MRINANLTKVSLLQENFPKYGINYIAFLIFCFIDKNIVWTPSWSPKYAWKFCVAFVSTFPCHSLCVDLTLPVFPFTFQISSYLTFFTQFKVSLQDLYLTNWAENLECPSLNPFYLDLFDHFLSMHLCEILPLQLKSKMERGSLPQRLPLLFQSFTHGRDSKWWLAW